MTEEIKKIIKKNLPQQVGDVLKQVLEQGEKDSKELKIQVDKNKTQNDDLINAREVIGKYKQFNDRNNQLEERFDSLKTRERKLEIEILTIKLEESNKRADAVTGFMSGLVRNTLFRKSIFDSETSAPFVDAQGITQYPTTINKSLESKEEKE